MAACVAPAHCQSGHVCSYVIALSNQMPVFNATHKQTNERTHRLEKIKYINIIMRFVIIKKSYLQLVLHTLYIENTTESQTKKSLSTASTRHKSPAYLFC